MESWENKIWADKLNSLQGFPAGYTPDLSSKWEIVEASLPIGKKRRAVPLLVRWSVAAAVLLAVGIVWMNAGKDQQIGLAAKEQSIMTVVFQQRQPVENEKFPADAHLSRMSHSYHQTTTNATNKKDKPAGESAHQLSAEIAAIPVGGDTNQGGKQNLVDWANAPFSTDSLSGTSIQQNTVATVLEDKKRPVKKKIYQRDFNDGVLAMDTGFAPSSRQHFSIQLNPFRHKAADDEPPARRLQLKQAL